MPKRRLTENFTLDELTFSQTASREGIDNTPSPEIQKSLLRLARFLEEVRVALGGNPLIISSGYRCAALNQRVGGSPNSAHMSGLAADFTVPAIGTVLQVCRQLEKSDLQFQQLIYEYGSWVHLAIPTANQAPARLVNSIFLGSGYLAGILSKPARVAAPQPAQALV